MLGATNCQEGNLSVSERVIDRGNDTEITQFDELYLSYQEHFQSDSNYRSYFEGFSDRAIAAFASASYFKQQQKKKLEQKQSLGEKQALSGIDSGLLGLVPLISGLLRDGAVFALQEQICYTQMAEIADALQQFGGYEIDITLALKKFRAVASMILSHRYKQKQIKKFKLPKNFYQEIKKKAPFVLQKNWLAEQSASEALGCRDAESAILILSSMCQWDFQCGEQLTAIEQQLQQLDIILQEEQNGSTNKNSTVISKDKKSFFQSISQENTDYERELSQESSGIIATSFILQEDAKQRSRANKKQKKSFKSHYNLNQCEEQQIENEDKCTRCNIF